jgi:hypothetical protein
LNLRALAPADIKLVAAPERSRELALLQVGNEDPREYVAIVSDPDNRYRVIPGGLKRGELIYGDRQYLIERLPTAFEGLTLLQTKLQHKPILDGRYAIVLETAKPCLVFVAVDENALETYKQHGVPSWLQEYAPAGHDVVTDRANFRVFVKQAPAGGISLGPPSLDVAAGDAMYFAFFAEAK